MRRRREPPRATGTAVEVLCVRGDKRKGLIHAEIRRRETRRRGISIETDFSVFSALFSVFCVSMLFICSSPD
jgi:hypothetical protein